MLKNRKVSKDIITKVVKYFEGIMPNVSQRINFFCELVADIRTPLEDKDEKEEEDEVSKINYRFFVILCRHF